VKTERHDLHACKQLMRHGSKSFFAAALLLPHQMRAPATALYAFCRVADDAIDLSADPTSAVAGLRARLSALYANAPHAHAADRALAPVVMHHTIPQSMLEALLEGFSWDAQGRQYENFEQLLAYAARVAGTVGAMMALIMGVRDAQALARASEMGVAMQLTNIARDVGEDARAGRLYLPHAWLREEGIEPASWLQAPVLNAPLRRVVARLITAADVLYARADRGIAQLPLRCRPAIRAARLIYAQIGRTIEARGHDSLHQRATVSLQRKLWLIACSAGAALFTQRAMALPPLAQIQFLVDAGMQPVRHQPKPHGFYARTVWVIGLFEKCALQDHAMRRVQ
jgi:15-cis-phytoene synthase